MPAQDDMMSCCCGGLGARSISVAKRVDQYLPLQRCNSARDVARAVHFALSDYCLCDAVMRIVMKCESPIAFGFIVYRVLGPAVKRFQLKFCSSTENALVP